MDLVLSLLAAARPTDKIQHLPTYVSLEDRCFYYIIHHLSEFPPGSLCLLPLTVRKKLLLNLPAVDIWRLEADSVTEGLDEESLWKSLIDERCQDVSQKHFRLPFFHKMPSRDLYFAYVWDHIFHDQQPSLFGNRSVFSKLLYNVPCVLGIEGFTISELNYQQRQYKLGHVIQNDPDVRAVFLHPNLIPKREFVTTIRYFGEVCRIRPKQICFHCMSVGKRIWIQAMEQSNSILRSFMANLEVVRFDGRGPLVSLEKFHRETQHERFKRLFLCIPKLFLGAAVANPQCNLKSIEIDAGDSQRASGLLASVQSVLSVGYSKVEAFSVKFHHVYSRGSHPDHGLTFHVLSDTAQLVSSQPQLRSIGVSFPEMIPSTGEDIEIRLSQERFAEFIATIEKYVQCPHFECLTLRNILTFETAQQIIRTFLSLPSSPNVQLLDIRTPDDITSQSDTIFEGPGKSLMISGTVRDDGGEQLTSDVIQMLCNSGVCNFEVVDSVSGILSALKQPVENLQVKSLCLTIRKVSQASEAYTPPRSQYRKIGRGGRHLSAYQRRLFQNFGMEIPHQIQGYHPDSERNQHKKSDVPQAIEFPEIPRVDKLIGNPSLLALRIRFQSAKDYISSSQVSNFLSTISDGLQLQSCNLRSLTLPKLDCPLGNDDLKHFFRCVFSSPHVEELELNLALIKFSLQSAEMIRSYHCETGGKKLAKVSLRYDSIIGNGPESSESIRALLNDISKDLRL